MVSSSHPYFSVLCLKSVRQIPSSNMSENEKCKMSETVDRMPDIVDKMSPPSQLIDLSFKTSLLAQVNFQKSSKKAKKKIKKCSTLNFNICQNITRFP